MQGVGSAIEEGADLVDAEYVERLDGDAPDEHRLACVDGARRQSRPDQESQAEDTLARLSVEPTIPALGAGTVMAARRPD